jgi:hypothetical protein
MKLSKLIRRTHMYLALFLTPWLLVYALSGFILNHRTWFFPVSTPGHEAAPPPFEKMGERAYDVVFSDDADPRMIGAKILEDVGLAGSFNVQGDGRQPKLVIMRSTASAAYRVTYLRPEKKVQIERQQFNAPMFLNRTHFRHGYTQPFAPSIAWAVIVDLVIVALVFWVLSGLWMWWEIKPARAWGAVFGLVGAAVFALLLFTI